jgi:hypothetical protein
VGCSSRAIVSINESKDTQQSKGHRWFQRPWNLNTW